MRGAVERLLAPERVFQRMPWIKMRAWHEARRPRRGPGMGAPVLRQLRQPMGMRAGGALAAGRGDRLVDLDAADAPDETAVRVRRKNDSHRPIGGIERRPAHATAQFGSNSAVGNADAKVGL